MIVRWATASQSYIKIEEGTKTTLVSAGGDDPDWLRVKDLMDAGEIDILPYEPPLPLDD